MKLQRAKLDADLGLLGHQREAAATLAQAEALEAAMEMETGLSVNKISTPLPPADITQRTKDYVQQQAEFQTGFSSMPSLEPAYNMRPPSPLNPANAEVTSCPLQCSPTSVGNQTRPHSPQKTPAGDQGNDFAKYLARRELVNTGLTHFDDRPENYRAWRSSFHNATKDLGITPSEELDLLVKWLGKESSDHVKRICAVHIKDPTTALKKSWERLKEQYAAPEVIESALFRRLDGFPRINSRDPLKLRQLGDLLMEVQCAKEDGYLPGLSYLDTARGVNPIVEKLPHGLQERWITKGSRYKKQHNACFPPFSFFAEFICSEAKTRNDPSFTISSNNSGPMRADKPTTRNTSMRAPISVHKTDVSIVAESSADSDAKKSDPGKSCPLHQKPHPLKKCRAFRAKTIDERRAFLRENGICFKCCASISHLAKECVIPLKCTECNSNHHSTAMHPGPAPWTLKAFTPTPQHGGEEEVAQSSPPVVNSQCTEVCGEGLSAKSCAKICLVKVYPQDQPESAVEMYAVIDDQSNRSLAKSDFFDQFDIRSSPSPYSLRTCAGVTEMTGRKADGFQIEAVNGGVSLPLPPLIECNEILNNRAEIPTPDVALHHAHLKSVAPYIPKLDPNAEILLLLGRDILRVHKVREQINGPHNAPFAQRLDIGWVLIGEVCLGDAYVPTVNSFKTHVLESGRPSFLAPCKNHICLREKATHSGEQQDASSRTLISNPVRRPADDKLGREVFRTTPEDNKPALSIEDTIFLQMMDGEFKKDDTNSWVAPLPFRTPRPHLPNNREHAVTRLLSLRRSLDRKPEMKKQFIDFIQKLFENDHAEKAPPLRTGEECWYLPTFGVYHPQKPEKIRVVFDSSAQHHGFSLNDVLLTGPDLNNSLLGVLIRFRKEPVAIIADIQQMFYCFVVREDHRNYLRFLWYRDNDTTKDVIDYRMKVHVFGNSPSPAVAMYGLRRAAQAGEQVHGADTREFVERHFYVDDGLKSLPTEEEAIDLLQRTRASLAESNLRLHKIASNSTTVMQAFPADDHAKGMKDFGTGDETGPVQRSLGLSWETTTDTFTFKVSSGDKPFTRRGVLSTVNSLFDPLGLVAPVTIQGRTILRELTTDTCSWDAPLPEGKLKEWEAWRDSLQELKNLHIPRTYSSKSLSKAQHTELCMFSDASIKAVAAVAYLRTVDETGQVDVGFVLGKAKLTPQSQPTIPRLELCAAVLAVEVAELILDEIDIKPDAVNFYCDSKVVLGYIYNETKRFYVYVHNRVQRIRQTTQPDQWHYFTGPAFLHKPGKADAENQDSLELVAPDSDAEIRPEVRSFITKTEERQLTPKRFEHFSTWKSLLRGVAFLIHVTHSFKKDLADQSAECRGWHQCNKPRTPDELAQAKSVIIKSVQGDVYSDEFASLEQKSDVSTSSSLSKLNPTLEDGFIKVGGRLKHAQLDNSEKNPILLPGRNHVSTLLVRHYHEQVKHQGRHFTEGAIRASGLWIVGGKRLINSVLHKCVTCKKLRGRMEEQKMADLPPERLGTSPPFTFVGLDVFGPWTVVARRTRGDQAQSKRWAVLFTCMSTRAIHIEVIEAMDTSSCINALRRFFAIRGPAKQLRSDCGTNFIGACNELQLGKEQQQGNDVQHYLSEHGCTWEFNPPHSSHMGGAWERMIGVARRILDSMMLQNKSGLSHEVLCTFLAEVTAIINARPLVPVSTDPGPPFILTPAMLLTQKVGAPPPPGDFTDKDLFKSQWRLVQSLASKFWSRWSHEYLPTLQSRRKWTETRRNLQEGDLVLLKDKQVARNEWPLALVTSTFVGDDGKVRTLEVKVTAQGTTKKFVRPIAEVVLLLPKED
ncbi:uncharacterized protein LOC119733659 [Patiria miniata]|uniref:Integrase catalytic domain-containing protein n=1 Tax=Patiria miniata TaxID=46514 RepID=A0A914AG82_PATMI|nr:uncharacterized protein LOC119733659 [Patiria miniata]